MPVDPEQHFSSGVYKMQYNLIFFLTPLFLYILILPRNYRLLSPIGYSSQQPLNQREDDFASRFSFFQVIFFHSYHIPFPSPVDNFIFFPNRLDEIKNFIHPLMICDFLEVFAKKYLQHV